MLMNLIAVYETHQPDIFQLSVSNPRTEISHLYHHTYISLYMARDCRINLYVRLVRIYFRQYGRRFAYTSRHSITFNTKPAFRKFFFLLFRVVTLRNYF